MTTIVDDEWEAFLNDDVIKTPICSEKQTMNTPQSEKKHANVLPKCDDLYISTTTKVLFLNQPIEIDNIFWEIPIIDYWKPKSGAIKKQMKIVSQSKEEYEKYTQKLKYLNYYNEHVIRRIDNPTSRRNKFKDERKITVGMSKKDIMNCRGKVKNAFYNCFALILRFIYNDEFHEIHAKIFNTGKMEIPGILNQELLNNTKIMLLSILRPIINNELDFVDVDKECNVLINSNFNCGFYIYREKLYSILRNKYNIESAFDPCSYPGVKCKFYFNHDYQFDKKKQKGVVTRDDQGQKMSELNDNKKYTEISFMVFRTGSCLIVGNCTEPILRYVYDYIKTILQTEYNEICSPEEIQTVKPKQEKIRKKSVIFTHDIYQTIVQS
jgi:hypothetical protein